MQNVLDACISCKSHAFTCVDNCSLVGAPENDGEHKDDQSKCHKVKVMMASVHQEPAQNNACSIKFRPASSTSRTDGLIELAA